MSKESLTIYKTKERQLCKYFGNTINIALLIRSPSGVETVTAINLVLIQYIFLENVLLSPCEGAARKHKTHAMNHFHVHVYHVHLYPYSK